MPAIVEVPDRVRRKALAVGREGERWLDDLTRLLTDLEAEWGIEVGSAISGGSGGYVANSVAADGTDAVLKISIPDGLEGNSPFSNELETLLLGNGHGYVRVLRADSERRVMLQERLGRPLSALGLPVEDQIDILAATLSRGWCTVPEGTQLRTGAEQADFLAGFIRATWEELEWPWSERTIDLAVEYVRARRAAFDPSAVVLIHGDAHPANVLQDTGTTREPSGFKLIDPDGMRSEPAHDLAIPLRDWSTELLAGDPVQLGLAWCAQLSERTGVDPRAIWEWAFVERVSTGLFLLQLRDPLGEQFLEVAALLTGAQP